MREEYRAQSTERINDEDWCAACKQPVEEWDVFFEHSTDADSGYDKVRRCPHCNAKSFEDGSSNVACLLFLIGMFGLPVQGFWLLRYFNVELNFEKDGTGVLLLALNCFAALLFSSAVCNLWKRRLYRERHVDG